MFQLQTSDFNEKKRFVWIFSFLADLLFTFISFYVLLLSSSSTSFAIFLVSDMHSLEIRKCIKEKGAGRMLANFSGFPFGLGRKESGKKIKQNKNYCFLYRITKSVTLTPNGGCVLRGVHNKLFSNSLTPTGCATIQF